jgi:hypothetical protein
VAEAALDHIEAIVEKWLPGGSWEGSNYVVCNPLRDDRNPGSFKIQEDGYFKDWACEEHKGGDLVALELPPQTCCRRKEAGSACGMNFRSLSNYRRRHRKRILI